MYWDRPVRSRSTRLLTERVNHSLPCRLAGRLSVNTDGDGSLHPHRRRLTPTAEGEALGDDATRTTRRSGIDVPDLSARRHLEFLDCSPIDAPGQSSEEFPLRIKVANRHVDRPSDSRCKSRRPLGSVLLINPSVVNDHVSRTSRRGISTPGSSGSCRRRQWGAGRSRESHRESHRRHRRARTCRANPGKDWCPRPGSNRRPTV